MANPRKSALPPQAVSASSACYGSTVDYTVGFRTRIFTDTACGGSADFRGFDN